MKPVMRMLMILIYALCLLTGCGGGNDVVSNDTSGILSIESVNVPAQSGGSGTVSVKLVAPKGGPGSGTVAISATESSLISFSPTSQSVNSNGTANFYFTTTEVTSDTIAFFTVTIGSLSISKQIILKAASSSSGVTVTSPTVNSISFVSASPTRISLQGAGGAGNTETSVVSFIVRDVAGDPIAGQTVDFSLDTSVGGLSIIPTSAVSDASGTVKTIVNAGIVSTPVRVTATVRSTSISVKSDKLTVSTGLPHQDGLSIAFSSPNPEAWEYDDEVVTVSAMLSDHFGNPVPDGTSVYFMAYGGSIEPVGTTNNGIATVKWRSQNPRPTNGIAKVLAYAIGEESFTDLNGNGVADTGEFTDMPEAFLAKSWTTDTTKTYCNPLLKNYNPLLDSVSCLIRDSLFDPYIDFNGDGIYGSGDGNFNGILQGSAYHGASRSLHVFRNSQIVMSGSNAFISTGGIALTGTTTEVDILVTDVNGNVMPEKTITAFSFAGTCLTATPASAIFRTTTAFTSIKNSCSGTGSDTLYVTVTTPMGRITRGHIDISY